MFTSRERRTLIVGTIALTALFAAAAWAAVGLSSLTPGPSEITGWPALQADKPAGAASELYKIYDGGDGEWKQAGVTSAFQRYYKNATTKHVLTLIIHRLGSAEKAKALFNKKNAALKGQSGYKSIQVAQQGTLATPSTGLSAHLWNKNYYCTLTINGTSTGDVSAAKSFMTSVAGKITKNG